MKQIKGINHIGFRVRSLEIARAFYEQLGFEFIIGPIGPEPVAVMEHPSGINLNLILNTTSDASAKNVLMDLPEKHTGYTHIALEIDDLEAVRKQLTALKISITETVELPDGAVLVFVRDPDGNVIEFHKPA
jgi:lactoylglutathione lyase